ncbi:MAG TPA: class I SAM-dependent methyltransferase [Candidatus Acidoferrales bacterium]|nr:class I SAM-dependent methyltransferase [Candidatus Acidoferrales bacterium]
MSAPDPAKIARFREKLAQEWTDADTVAAWRKWQPQLSAFTRGATDAVLEAAQLGAGNRVLDLASGVGDPAIPIAKAIGPTGQVTGTDIGPGMIAFAAELAKARRLRNIEFRVADVEALPFPDNSFDVVSSRFGIMFFVDQLKAFRECLRVLKPGGRVSFVVWGTREQPFLGATIGILMKYIEAPKPDPDAPHAFMFGERGLLASKLKAAGFADAREEVRTVVGRWEGTTEEYWQQFTELAAPFRPLIAKLTPEMRARVECEIYLGLRKFADGSGFSMPLEIVIGTGVKP